MGASAALLSPQRLYQQWERSHWAAQEIDLAYHRLGQLLDPQLGGTPYLSMKITEARDVLLGE